MRDRFPSRYTESDCDALRAEANSTSFYSVVLSWGGLQWLFLALGIPILMISIVFASTRAQDAWILENILPAFVIFSFLLGITLLIGSPRLAELSAALALGVVAIIPSVKYGFVYGNPDPVGHYSTGVEIARTGSVAGVTFYSQPYAPTPLMHILEAATGLTVGLPVDAVMGLAIFVEHFVIFLLVAESARRMFPRIERRLIVFLALITVPVLPRFVGTTYGLLPLAMLTYVFSRTITRRSEVILAATTMLVMVLSHFVTTVYFLVALAGYCVSLPIVRRFGNSISTREIREGIKRPPFFSIVIIAPLLFVIFMSWLVTVGGDYIYYVRLLTFEFTGAPPLSPVSVPLFDTILTILYANARFVFSGLTVLVASSIWLIRHRNTGTFLLLWCLFASGVLMGAAVGSLYSVPQVFRFAAWLSMLAPYFACFLISRRKGKPWLLNTSQVRAVKVAMLGALVLSIVAVYPMTPLYPKWTDAKPVLEDVEANTIYCVSGVNFLASFSPVYSSRPITTTPRIFADMYSLHPKFTHLDWTGVVSTNLESVTSLSELRNQIVVFDLERSGRQTLPMRAVVLPLLSGGLRTGTLGMVYSNGSFYVAMAP